MNYTGPKVKLSRKIGINMTPKARKYAGKKPYPPGQHGMKKRRRKLSDFGKQLLEKQKLKLQYNISEHHLFRTYEEAAHQTGNTGDLLLQGLEHRLDALVLRAGFARSIYAARQYVSHGHIFVNGKKVDIPSYKVKLNDVISVKEKSRKIDAIQEAVRGGQNPPYLETDKANFTAKLLAEPNPEEIPVNVEVPLVIEFYSR